MSLLTEQISEEGIPKKFPVNLGRGAWTTSNVEEYPVSNHLICCPMYKIRCVNLVPGL